MPISMKVQLPIPTQFVLSILAPSYLITSHWGESLAKSVIDLGIWSEEIFRGDRLPPLPFPDSAHPDHPAETPTNTDF